MEPGEYFVMTCEEPHHPDNDPVVLGCPARYPLGALPEINRYLLAGLEIAHRSRDEALWRVRQDALQRLFRDLSGKFTIYGYQFEGNAAGLPEAWRIKLLYLNQSSRPMRLGQKMVTRAMDSYVMPLELKDFESFILMYGEEGWFRFFLVKPRGAPFSQDEFQRLNTVYARDSTEPGLIEHSAPETGGRVVTSSIASSVESYRDRLDTAVMAHILDGLEAVIWYTYSPRGRDVDGPHIGICTRSSWKGRLRRLFRPGTSRRSILLDLSVPLMEGRYCLDIVQDRGTTSG